MQIHVTARAEDITNSMKKYAEEKVQKLEKYFARIHTLDVILAKEHEQFVAEIKVTAGRGKEALVSKKKHEDMSASIDFVVDKMERQLTKLKEKVRDHRSGGVSEASASGEGTAPDNEETYDDVIRSKDF